jgi:hypothetical protein
MVAFDRLVLGPRVLLLCVCLVGTTLCTPREPAKTRTPPVDIYDLVVGISVFPEDWHVCVGPARPPERARGAHDERDMLYVGYCPEGFEHGIGGAEHDVFRYANQLEAAASFDSEFSRSEFSNQHMVSSWAVPNQWSYESPIADRFKFGCGQLDWLDAEGQPLWSCTAVGQYDEYVSVFGAHMSHMTLEDMERILIAIDDKMALHLGEDAE